LWAALHQPSHALTAPDLYSILGEAKVLYWLLPDLFDRVAAQLDRRASSGGLLDDRGPDHDPSETARTAVGALGQAATQITEAGRFLDNAHNALGHLGDNGTGIER
jgi:hypothetical protein